MSSAGGTGSIPGQGTKIPHAKKKKKMNLFLCFEMLMTRSGSSRSMHNSIHRQQYVLESVLPKSD